MRTPRRCLHDIVEAVASGELAEAVAVEVSIEMLRRSARR
jgi:hypothetical protein